MKIFNFIVAIIMGIIVFVALRYTDEIIISTIKCILLGIIGFLGAYNGANIADILRRMTIPDTVYYRNASDYLSTKFYYTFGMNIVGAVVGAIIGVVGFLFIVTKIFKVDVHSYGIYILGIIFIILLSAMSTFTERLVDDN